MTWGFIWLMFILKIPIIGLLWLVWWAIRQSNDPVQGEEVKVRSGPHPPSTARRPKRPRGPHSDPLPLPPPRIRTVSAVSREHADR